MRMLARLACVVITICGGWLGSGAEAARPNVLMIMIDDLGWMDVAFQGNRLVETPRLDELCQQSMRFTDAYAAAPVCSPTRAAVVTGLAPARLHITNHLPDRKSFIPDDPRWLPAKMLDHLPARYETIAERMKQLGYTTGFMGKWHLCGASGRQGRGMMEVYPERQGFDSNLGGCALGGPPSFFSPYKIHNLPDGEEGEYLPDRLANEAIRFISDHQQQPFMLFLWNYTVHWPMQAPQALLDKYQDRKGRGLNDTRYGAMIEAMDGSLGRIFDHLEKLDLADNTIVIFTSDNGGFSGVADNRPLRAGKGYLYEGGIRVPLLVRWPGKIQAGTTCTEPVISMDFFPTLIEAAGGKPPELCDGMSLIRLLSGKQQTLDRALYFHYPNYAFHRGNRLGSAIRRGSHKLIHYYDGGTELYDLAEDLGEKRNLAESQAKLAARLKSELDEWRREVQANRPQPAE